MPHQVADIPYTRARTNWKPTPHLAATAGQPDLDKMVKRALPATSQADEVPGRKCESILEDLSRSGTSETALRDVFPSSTGTRSCYPLKRT